MSTNVNDLATRVAQRARALGVAPPEVVDAVLKEHSIECDVIRSSVLSECGQRGNRRRQKLKLLEEARRHEQEEILRDRSRELAEAQPDELLRLRESTNEHIIPID